MIRMGGPGIIMLARNIMTREPTCCGHSQQIVYAEFDILETQLFKYKHFERLKQTNKCNKQANKTHTTTTSNQANKTNKQIQETNRKKHKQNYKKKHIQYNCF